MITVSLPALALFAAGAALGQTFDVASVKPSPPPPGDSININLGTASHGTVTLTNTTLSECIRWAYGLESEDLVSGPDWIRDRALRVDIVAKAPPDTPMDQLLLMTQALLAERFRLKLHHAPKAVPHFELTVARDGPKMPESKSDASALRAYGRGRLDYLHLSPHTLAVLLSRQLRQPVIDRTGLEGFFDVKLEWEPDDAPPATDPAVRPDIYSAVQQQLGLRLEPKKTPIDCLVVDSAEKVPIGN